MRFKIYYRDNVTDKKWGPTEGEWELYGTVETQEEADNICDGLEDSFTDKDGTEYVREATWETEE